MHRTYIMYVFCINFNARMVLLNTRCESTNHPQPTEEDIMWLLKEARRYLNPEIKLDRTHVLSAWAGIRPLATVPHQSLGTDGNNTAAASRDHIIHHNRVTGTVFAAVM